MGSERRLAAVAVLGIAALLPVPGGALAGPEGGNPVPPGPGPGPGPTPASAARLEKVKRFYFKLGYGDAVRTDARGRILRLLAGDQKRTDEALKRLRWGPVDDFLVREVDRWADEKSVDDALALLDGPDGPKVLTLLRIDRSLTGIRRIVGPNGDWKAEERLVSDYGDVLEKALFEGIPEVAGGLNETAAVGALRHLIACQAQIQTSGKIDCDDDGVGEHGTILELTGAVGVRRGFTAGTPSSGYFDGSGDRVDPPVLSPRFQGVDKAGIVTLRGYCFRVFLPDTSTEPFQFTHEKGPAASVGLEGGSGRIGIDLSETTWCAYAWPEKRGVTGTRVFYVDQTGDVLAAPNATSKWSGTEKAPPWTIAFTRPDLLASPAPGKKGNDGEVWTLVQ